MRRLLRRLRDDLVLLPLALLLVVVEDVLWRGARAVLRTLNHQPAVQGLRGRIARLPAAAALPLFLVPEAAGRAGEVWAAWLLYRRHVTSAVLVYGLVRLLAALIAVFIWQACAPTLLRLAWFARLAAWVEAVRDWALARTAPLRARALRWLRRGGGGVLRRLAALRRRMRSLMRL